MNRLLLGAGAAFAVVARLMPDQLAVPNMFRPVDAHGRPDRSGDHSTEETDLIIVPARWNRPDCGGTSGAAGQASAECICCAGRTPGGVITGIGG